MTIRWRWLVNLFCWCFAGLCITALVLVCTGWFQIIPAADENPSKWEWTGPIHPLLLYAICTIVFYLFAKLVTHLDKKSENNSGDELTGYGFMPTDPGDHMGDSGPRPVGCNKAESFSGIILSDNDDAMVSGEAMISDGGDFGGGGAGGVE